MNATASSAAAADHICLWLCESAGYIRAPFLSLRSGGGGGRVESAFEPFATTGRPPLAKELFDDWRFWRGRTCELRVEVTGFVLEMFVFFRGGGWMGIKERSSIIDKWGFFSLKTNRVKLGGNLNHRFVESELARSAHSLVICGIIA